MEGKNRMIANLKTFLKNTCKTIYTVVKEFIISTVKNSPALFIMITAAFGTTTLIAQYIPLEAMLVSVSFISETMVVPVLAIMLIYMLATLAGTINKPKYQTTF